MIGSISLLPTPWSHRSGRTVNGPKNPTLPQLVAKFDPTSSPSTIAAKAACGSAAKRVLT
jgi:hypothetical protein